MRFFFIFLFLTSNSFASAEKEVRCSLNGTCEVTFSFTSSEECNRNWRQETSKLLSKKFEIKSNISCDEKIVTVRVLQ